MVKHLQVFDRQGGQTVTTIGHLVPPALGILWNQLSGLFIELHGCDETLWRECMIMKLIFPIASAKGTQVAIKAANPSTYGIQNASTKAEWSSIAPNDKALVEAIEICVIDWLVERSEKEAQAPVQMSLLDTRLNELDEDYDLSDLSSSDNLVQFKNERG